MIWRILCHAVSERCALAAPVQLFCCLVNNPRYRRYKFLEMEQPTVNDKDISIKEFLKTPPPQLKCWEEPF